MHTTTEMILATYICLVWAIVWWYSHSIDRSFRPINNKIPESQQESRTNSSKHSLPMDRRLVFCSGALIVLLCIFYIVLYLRIELWPSLFDISVFSSMLLTETTQLLLVTTILAGAVLMIQARRGLDMLTSKEVVFSLNKNKDQQSSSRIYKSMRHPMYVGMTLITISSLLLFPSVLGAFLLIGIYLLLVLKILIEN